MEEQISEPLSKTQAISHFIHHTETSRFQCRSPCAPLRVHPPPTHTHPVHPPPPHTPSQFHHQEQQRPALSPWLQRYHWDGLLFLLFVLNRRHDSWYTAVDKVVTQRSHQSTQRENCLLSRHDHSTEAVTQRTRQSTQQEKNCLLSRRYHSAIYHSADTNSFDTSTRSSCYICYSVNCHECHDHPRLRCTTHTHTHTHSQKTLMTDWKTFTSDFPFLRVRTIGVFLPVTRRCCCKAPNFGARQRNACKQQVALQMLLLLPKQAQRDKQAAGEQHPVLALHTHLITITSHINCHSQRGWILFLFPSSPHRLLHQGMRSKVSAYRSWSKFIWPFKDSSMRRCSTPSSRRLEMLMRRRGKSPGSCGCPAPISACSAWIRSSWRRLTLSRFRSPGRSAHKVDCWANGAVTLRLWSTFEHGHMITTWRSMSPTEVM